MVAKIDQEAPRTHSDGASPRAAGPRDLACRRSHRGPRSPVGRLAPRGCTSHDSIPASRLGSSHFRLGHRVRRRIEVLVARHGTAVVGCIVEAGWPVLRPSPARQSPVTFVSLSTTALAAWKPSAKTVTATVATEMAIVRTAHGISPLTVGLAPIPRAGLRHIDADGAATTSAPTGAGRGLRAAPSISWARRLRSRCDHGLGRDRRRAWRDRLRGGVLAEPAPRRPRPRARAVRAGPLERRVAGPQPDHPALLPPARLRPLAKRRTRRGRRSRRSPARRS